MFKQMRSLMRIRWGCCLREFRSVHATPISNKFLVFLENKRSGIQPFHKRCCPEVPCRSYSKSRDRKRERNKKTKFNEDELRKYFDVDKLLIDIEKPVNVFREELIKHASIRSSAGAVENLKVKFEGEEYTIQDLAEIGKKNANMVVLDFSTFPSALPSALRVLQKSELNLNAQQEGNRLIVPLPKVTQEHRQLLSKRSKLYFVKCREGIREVQMKYVKALGKVERLPTQDKFRIIDQLTALGDLHIESAEEILKAKQNDLMKGE